MTKWNTFGFHNKGQLKHPDATDSCEAAQPALAVRILALALVFSLTFGGSITYSSVAALADTIKHEYKLTDSQYNALFSIYALPNIATALLSGMVVDKIGIHRTCMGLTSLLMVGVLLAIYPSYYALLAGRMIYGIGNESIGVIESTMLARWFTKDTKITLALSCSICLISTRLGGFTAMQMLPALGERSLLLANIAVAAVASTSMLAGKHCLCCVPCLRHDRIILVRSHL